MVIQVDGNYVTGRYVNVGFDGDDVYLNGISSMFPDAWIKGSAADGKVTIPSHQYIGADEVNSSFGFFYGATEEQVYNEEWDFWYTVTNFADNLTFDYDAAARTMTTEGTLLINKGDGEVYAIESFTAPRIAVHSEVTDFTPMDPIQGLFSEPGDNVYESDIVTAYSAGIDEMAESEVASIEWYDISGCRVQRPAKGIYIKRTVYENGSVKTAKTIVR